MGAYCKVYGDTIENRVLEEFLTFRDAGVTVAEIVEGVGISKPKAYDVVYNFLKKGYILKYKVIGKTQLYTLNKDHKLVKIFRRNFNECLKLALEESLPPTNSRELVLSH